MPHRTWHAKAGFARPRLLSRARARGPDTARRLAGFVDLAAAVCAALAAVGASKAGSRFLRVQAAAAAPSAGAAKKAA